MANKDRPAGCKPYKGIQRRDCYMLLPIDLDYGTDIFIGDVVLQTADHGITQVAAGGDLECGVALEFFDNKYQPILYYKAADYTSGAGLQCYAMVCVDPLQRYVIQDDAAATGDNSTPGNNCDLVVGTGSSINGCSAMELGFGTLATTAALQTHIWGFELRDDNALGTHCDWIVTLNQYQFPQCTAGGFAVGGLGV